MKLLNKIKIKIESAWGPSVTQARPCPTSGRVGSIIEDDYKTKIWASG